MLAFDAFPSSVRCTVNSGHSCFKPPVAVTWDMSLPEPVVQHTFANNVLKIEITKCGWFNLASAMRPQRCQGRGDSGIA